MTRLSESRRKRPRSKTSPSRYHRFLRQSHKAAAQCGKTHRDDWPMEWLCEDFTLWAEIKLHPKALVQMMSENMALTLLNAKTNQNPIQSDLRKKSLSYLIRIMILSHKKSKRLR